MTCDDMLTIVSVIAAGLIGWAIGDLIRPLLGLGKRDDPR